MSKDEKQEPKISIVEKDNGKFLIASTEMKEVTNYYNLGNRDQNVIKEIFYGRLVPVEVIRRIYYQGHESYRRKRMSVLKQKKILALSSYCKISPDGKTRTIGQLYRLTDSGKNAAERILNKEEKQGNKIPGKDKTEGYWYLGKYRVMAYEMGIHWQYGREVREQIYINNNIQISAIIGDVCLYMVGKRPHKNEIKHLRGSIKHLVESGYKTHIIICPSSAVRKQVIFRLLEMEYDEKQSYFLYEKAISVFIKTVDDAQVSLEGFLQGTGPHDLLVSSLRQGTEIEIVDVDHKSAVTPFIGNKGDESFFLSSFSDYNIIEFINVCKYNSELFQKGGWPGKVLMHIKDISQLNEIAEIYKTYPVPKCGITYLLQEHYNGSNAYLIESGTLIPVR